jgi:N-methylhydantoinase B
VNGAISHANDWLMLMPIYHGGRIIAWAAMFGHMTDVGGKVPGSLPTDGTHDLRRRHADPADQDLQGNGELNDDVLKVVLHNCRLPHWNLSDFNAITPRCAPAALPGARDRRALRRRRVLLAAMDAMLERNKRAMRELIRCNGARESSTSRTTSATTASAWARTRSNAAMWREGDKRIFDFAGTDPQSISPRSTSS